MKESECDYLEIWNNLNSSEIKYDLEQELQVLENWDSLIKPVGSLGKLEKIIAQLYGIRAGKQVVIDKPIVTVFAADHGIAKDDTVTQWPQEITGKLLEQMSLGKTAINCIAESNSIALAIFDCGTICNEQIDKVTNIKLKHGSGDIRTLDALTSKEVITMITTGALIAKVQIQKELNLFITGEVGIGNTTAASIIISKVLDKSASVIVGRGAGATDEGLVRKIEVVSQIVQSMELVTDPIEILRLVGGLEICTLVGYMLQLAISNQIIILDGIITQSAALVASLIRPELKKSLIFSHISAEPSAIYLREYFDCKPILDLNLRLGEGTGGALSYPIIKAAFQCYLGMANIKELNFD